MEQVLLPRDASGARGYDQRPPRHRSVDWTQLSQDQYTQAELRYADLADAFMRARPRTPPQFVAEIVPTEKQIEALGVFKAGAYLILVSMVLAAASFLFSGQTLPLLSAVAAFVGCMIAARGAERFRRGQ